MRKLEKGKDDNDVQTVWAYINIRAETSKVRAAVFRPIYRQFFWILVIDVLMLGSVGAMPAEGIYLVLARS